MNYISYYVNNLWEETIKFHFIVEESEKQIEIIGGVNLYDQINLITYINLDDTENKFRNDSYPMEKIINEWNIEKQRELERLDKIKERLNSLERSMSLDNLSLSDKNMEKIKCIKKRLKNYLATLKVEEEYHTKQKLTTLNSVDEYLYVQKMHEFSKIIKDYIQQIEPTLENIDERLSSILFPKNSINDISDQEIPTLFL